MRKYYLDSFGNAAMIERGKGYPYKGASRKKTEYRLTCFATYDDNKIYFVSIYESRQEAEQRLAEMSAGTFKEMEATTA